jgi:capsular exopolysaccharide synthesis family protein
LLRSREQDAIVSALQVNIVQQQKVQDQIDNLGDEFRRNPDLIKRYEGLQQRLEVARDNLGSYLKARETFRLEVAQSTIPWQLISPPQFGVVPVEPNLQSRLLMGLLLGVVLGAGVAYTRDLLDNVFHSKKEVEELLGLPILGTVPYLPLNPDEPIQESVKELDPEERFALRESLRGFYQSLRTLRANRTLRVVALTSSSAGEGKSTTSALLGQTLVDMGMKVLLVDADLRRSRLHRRLGVDNAHGLSELFGENPPPLEQLYQWINPGLALLSGGPQLPDPARLLSSPRCAEIISQIRSQNQFDLILFDTPPALELVDPLLIAEHMDGLILLVSMGKVKRNLPSMVMQKCQSSEVDLLGVVTNSRVETYSTFGGYGYGYGDRYGYGSNYVTQAAKEDD